MERKKYSELKKEIKHIRMMRGAAYALGGAVAIASFIFVKNNWFENFKPIDYAAIFSPQLLHYWFTYKLSNDRIKKASEQINQLYHYYKDRKDDYLYAFDKKANNEDLTEDEEDVLFGFPEYIKIESEDLLTWFEMYEIALKRGYPIGITPVNNRPNETIFKREAVSTNNKKIIDAQVAQNFKTIKEKLAAGCPYAEFQLFIPIVYPHVEPNRIRLGFTNLEHVCKFEQQMNKIKKDTVKMINKRSWQKNEGQYTLIEKFLETFDEQSK